MKDYGHSLMKDGEFEQAKSFTVQTKGFRQRGKKNKPNTSVTLTEEEIKLFYKKELNGSGQESCNRHFD